MLERLRTARGVARSLRVYYGDRQRRAALDRAYARFVHPGELVFDVGAHVGDRVGAFRRLGARVVAVEPQPALASTLRWLYGRDADVVVEAVAVGRAGGTTELRLNLDNPTVSTASPDFVRAADGAPGWTGQRWTKTIQVPMTTLDALAATHGCPSFIKIDVEGFEAEALAGLSAPVRALSFEFTTIQRGVALACLDRCVALGFSRFAGSLGESLQFAQDNPLDPQSMARWLANLPHAANSGDVYAMRG